MKPERLDELIEKHLAGECSPAEHEELMISLSQSEAARLRLVDKAESLVELSEVLGRPQPGIPKPRRRSLSLALPALIAASILVALAVNGLRSDDQSTDLDSRDVASQEQVEKKIESGSFRDQPRSSSKSSIDPEAGLCEAGPDADYEIGGIEGGRQVLKLKRGRLSLDVAAGQKGFSIQTAEGLIEDIGTRFELDAQSEGTRLRVLEGRVHFDPADAGAGFDLAQEAGPTLLLRDGRVASVQELQGLAWVRPGASERRSPIQSGAVIRIGDLLGTGQSGAHAIALQLTNGARLYLGPESTVAFEGPDRLRLVQGDCALDVPKDASIAITVDGKEVLRAREGETYYGEESGQLKVLPTLPFWLDGFRNDRLVESLGKLLAKVDGRDVPLTMGYHKVSVDIRDQIARTVIEETFINHSKARLEGVFYFPLPSDASISSFAMWIGDEKVEGEIVEKQRAREIYETILRERRDPGLLEWTGGSIFKASIFPIDYEKKIQIGYTQVLPKRNGKVRYRYPLRSELLRRNPLSRLELIVKLWSDSAIASFRSLSHPGRDVLTENAASFEFSADNYIPERDFELEYQTKTESNSLQILPHQRGDDGYFMALAEAPASTGDDRGLLPTTGAQDWLILVDNSASIDEHLRQLQSQLLEGLLTPLNEKDRFNVALFDVQSRWFYADRREGGDTSSEEVLAMLREHEPLGWTDHAQILEEARSRCKPGTKIILIGDGADSLKTEDLGGFGRALSESWNDGPPVHVVALGTATEDILLEDLARLGGGSFRRLTLAEEASERALELADSLLLPGLSDLSLEIDGVPTAAIHLVGSPSIPAGGQAVLVGRFDSQVSGKGLKTAHLRGRQGQEKFEITSSFNLKVGDIGNSFIPRLWARRHLDYLQRLGHSPKLVAQIIQLSAEFQIATPYTSFLVLESDADRERFGIDRRTRMRDGEDFFSEGRESANFDLVKAQMERAQAWRDDLSERVLAKYRDSGNDLMGEIFGGYDRDRPSFFSRSSGRIPLVLSNSSGVSYDFYGEVSTTTSIALPSAERAKNEGAWEAGLPFIPQAGGNLSIDTAAVNISRSGEKYLRQNFSLAQPFGGSHGMRDQVLGGYLGSYAYGFVPQYQSYSREKAYPLGGTVDAPQGGATEGPFSQFFPYLPLPQIPPRSELDWPEQALLIGRQLNIMTQLAAKGVELSWTIKTERPSARERTIQKDFCFSSKSFWLQEQSYWGEPVTEFWSLDDETASWSELWNSGRKRKARTDDREILAQKLPLLFHDFVARNQHSELIFEDSEEGQVRFRFFQPESRETEYRYTVQIFPLRIIKMEQFFSGNLQHSETMEDFVGVHGLSLPQRVRHEDAGGKSVRVDTFRFQTKTEGELKASMMAAIEKHADALFLPDRPISVAHARQAVLKEKADLLDQVVILDDLYSSQRFGEARPHLAVLQQAAEGRPLFWAIQLTVDRMQGLQEELKMKIAAVTRDILSKSDATNLARVRYLFSWAGSLAVSERMEIFLAFEEFIRMSMRESQIISWRDQVLTIAQSWDRREEYEALLDAFMDEFPQDMALQRKKLNILDRDDRLEEYLNLCLRLMKDKRFSEQEQRQIQVEYLNKLFNESRFEEYIAFRESQMREEPEANHDLDHRLLRAFLHTGQVSRFDDFVTASLALGFADGGTSENRARILLGLQSATGGHNYRHLTRHALKFLPQIMDLADLALEKSDRDWILLAIIDAFQEREGDFCARIEARLAARIMAHLEEMTTQEIIAWESHVKDEVDLLVLRKELMARALKTTSVQETYPLFYYFRDHGRFEDTQVVLEHMLSLAQPGRQMNEINQLIFGNLYFLDFSEENEDRQLSLALGFTVETEGTPERDHQILLTRLRALDGLIPSLQAKRREKALESIDKLEELGPRALQAQKEECQREALSRIADKLALRAESLDSAISLWLRFYALDLRRQASVSKDKLLTESLKLARDCYGALDDRQSFRKADSVLSERVITLAASLAIHSGRLSEIDDLLRDLKKSPRTGLDLQRVELEWLCASKRTTALSQALNQIWSTEEPAVRVLYGKTFAQILAAEGQIDAAIQTLTELEVLRPLEADEKGLIADWRHLQDDRAGSDSSHARKFAAMSEWELSSYLGGQLNRFQGGKDQPPEQLGEDEIRAFLVLFERSTNPSQHTDLLLNYWRTTKDHRLLQGLAASLKGQSSQGIYNYIFSMRRLIDTIHDEAALDALDQAIEDAMSQTQAPVVRRALSVLRLHFMERALDQMNGSLAWRARLIESLKSAFPASFAKGEALRYVDSLAMLERVEDLEVRRIIVEQMARTMATTEVHSEERFKVAATRARFLWVNDEKIGAVDVMESALQEIASNRGGRLPFWSRYYQTEYAQYLFRLSRESVAVQFWRKQLALDNHASQVHWLRLQLMVAYAAGLETNTIHYEQIRTEVLGYFQEERSHKKSRELLDSIRNLWILAARHQKAERGLVRADLEHLAFGELPGRLSEQHFENAVELIQIVASALRELSDDEAALGFLFQNIQAEPRNREALGEPLWNFFAHMVADILRRRVDGKVSKDWIDFIEREMVADLESGISYDRAGYSKRAVYFIASKKDDYRRLALEILRKRPAEEAVALRVALYLAYDLVLPEEAAETLQNFHIRQGLSESGFYTLIECREVAQQFALAAELIGQMATKKPEDLNLQIRWAQALHRANRIEKSQVMARAIEDHFLAANLRRSTDLEAIARLSYGVGNWEQSVRLFRDLIRQLGREGNDTGGSWEIRKWLSDALIQLNRTDEAVESAMAAVALYGGNQSMKTTALNHLSDILERAKDFDEWLIRFDAEVEKTKLDQPILRRAAAEALARDSRYAAAAKHYALALQAAPENEAWRDRLAELYISAENEEAADRVYLEQARHSPHDFKRWMKLGDRLARRGKSELARRVRTSVVEFSAREAEGLRLYADMLENKGERVQAIEFWKRASRAQPTDPQGLLGQLRCLVELCRKDEALQVAQALREGEWDKRFGNMEPEIAERLKSLDR